jgi:hypothetical protein
LSDQEQKAPKEKARAEPKADEVELVTMTKGDESLDVHPTCVAAHKAVGWQIK